MTALADAAGAAAVHRSNLEALRSCRAYGGLNLRNINYNDPFTVLNNNNQSNYEIIYNDTRNQTSIIDLISRQVTNNVLNILSNNNYNNNQINQSNLNLV